MLAAEINGKLPEVENIEDVLTSNVFGLLQYIRNKNILLKILGNAETISRDKFSDKVNVNLHEYSPEFIFWENIPKYGEPDLIINFKKKHGKELFLCVEVKFYSHKSGEGDNDQLRRYFEGLDTRSTKNDSEFLGVIYLTKFPAKKEIEDSLAYLKDRGYYDADSKLFQLRWVQVTSAIQDNLHDADDPIDRAILGDMLEYQKYKNLVEFSKFTFIQVDFSLKPDTFYHYDKTDENFNGFFFINNDFSLSYKNNIFYRG